MNGLGILRLRCFCLKSSHPAYSFDSRPILSLGFIYFLWGGGGIRPYYNVIGYITVPISEGPFLFAGFGSEFAKGRLGHIEIGFRV